MNRIRIGTRGSQLALKQAALVQEALAKADNRIETELLIYHTKGDRIQDRPISEIGDKGVFASELEQALLRGQIDLAVHSAKDLPMKLADGLTISGILKRADVRHVLVVPRGGRIPSLRQAVRVRGGGLLTEDGAVQQGKMAENIPYPFRIGTGSRRRQMLAAMTWENVICQEIRGNVDTRLRKLQEGSYDGILLAKAGLDRLGMGGEQAKEWDFYPLSPELFLPAACQGIIAVETAKGAAAGELGRRITDVETQLCYQIEREVLAQLAVDCSEAAAAWCRLAREERSREGVYPADEQLQEAVPAADDLMLDVMYAEKRVRLTCAAKTEEGKQLARQAALLVKGERQI